MKTRNLIVFILALILAGCSPAGVTTPPAGIATGTPVVDPTPLPSATIRPTNTATLTDIQIPTFDPVVTVSPMTRLPEGTPPANSQYEGGVLAFPGTVYTWRNFPSLYTKYSASELGAENIHQEKPSLTESSMIHPEDGFVLSFANYIDQVAYFYENYDGMIELIIADTELGRVSQVWQDQNYWLHDISEKINSRTIDIIWGPGDNSLIINSNENEGRVVLFSVSQNRAYPITGVCNQVAPSFDDQSWIVVCKARNEQAYFILNPSGEIVESTNPPEKQTTSDILNWMISFDGEKVLFAIPNREHPEEIEIYLKDLDGVTTKLPFYQEQYTYSLFQYTAFKIPFKWSQNGEQVLIYGYDPDEKICPESYVSGNIERSPCWIVFDTKSGKVINAIGIDTLNQLGINTRVETSDLSMDFDAEFSPNGEWIVSQIWDTSIYYIVLIRLNNLEAYKYDLLKVDLFRWIYP